MRKSNLGNLAIIALPILNLIIWLAFPPVDDGRPNFARAYAGEILGSTVIILMACALFLSTRPKWAEPFFGGLDKMYLAHKRAAVSAFLLLFLHILTVPITTVGLRLGNYLAMIAFLGIVTLVLVTISPRIPILSKLTGGSYDGWRKFHRYMGIFYTLGFVHALTVDGLSALVAITWVQVIFIVGLVSYLYTEMFGRFFKKQLPYSVEAVRYPNASTAEVTLTPKGAKMKHRAGQFLFVRFPGDRVLNEPHPFTVSSAPAEPALRLTIKACGDFTRHLHRNLKAGMDAVVEGGYGLFDYRRGGPKQIWIAGGIGLTPFLSFLRDAAGKLDRDVHFHYTARTREEALFLDEIRAAAKGNRGLKANVRFSAADGPLTADEIAHQAGPDLPSREIYLCGPLPMVQAFARDFRSRGVPARRIHYEEFNFR
jgi:predicted ferric reductase